MSKYFFSPWREKFSIFRIYLLLKRTHFLFNNYTYLTMVLFYSTVNKGATSEKDGETDEGGVCCR